MSKQKLQTNSGTWMYPNRNFPPAPCRSPSPRLTSQQHRASGPLWPLLHGEQLPVNIKQVMESTLLWYFSHYEAACKPSSLGSEQSMCFPASVRGSRTWHWEHVEDFLLWQDGMRVSFLWRKPKGKKSWVLGAPQGRYLKWWLMTLPRCGCVCSHCPCGEREVDGMCWLLPYQGYASGSLQSHKLSLCSL